MPDTGSAYGGKHTGEAALEAARLARAAGRPVKMVWTREEEFTWAYFRPAGVIEIKSGVAADGTLTAWEFHNYNSGAVGYRLRHTPSPNQHIEFHPVQSPLAQGSYRGLAATANHFARETHMDDLAHAVANGSAGIPPEKYFGPSAACRVGSGGEIFGWPAKKPKRTGIWDRGRNSKRRIRGDVRGDFDRRARGAMRVVRVVTAFECGAVVNPDGLRNQIMGANIMGLGGALFEAMEFDNGRITNARFSRYRVPRFRDVPEMEAVLLDRKDIPSAGAGETPIVGVAPAIGNAIFDATVVRRRLCR